jgi:hypothetical protein
MVTFTEGRHAGEGLLSEANFHRSRDKITILSGQGKLDPGTVLAKVTASGKYVVSAATGADGSQTAVAVLLYPVDATSTDVDVAAITRQAEWNVNTLTYGSTVNDDAKKLAARTQLAAVGIITR